MVVDGKEGLQFDGILSGAPVCSADSQHIAYAARQGDKWVVIVDGQDLFWWGIRTPGAVDRLAAALSGPTP